MLLFEQIIQECVFHHLVTNKKPEYLREHFEIIVS